MEEKMIACVIAGKKYHRVIARTAQSRTAQEKIIKKKYRWCNSGTY